MSETSTLPATSGFDWHGFDAYLFDIDGTLLNSRDWVHYNAFHTALQHVYQCDARIDNVPVHGNTDIGILRAAAALCGVGGERFEHGLVEAQKLMAGEVEKHADQLRPELCPSIRELLDRLHVEGKLMGVCTGNLQRIGWTKLKAAGIRDRFAVGGFSDHHEFRADIFRHAMEQATNRLGSNAKACFIGDTPNDIHAAQKLGMPVVAVATGIYPIEQLQALHPTHCVPCCKELL
ncbi:HAD-superfamily hydrolase, subfamily IA, variant 1 [Candidatus Koribacter versatilis Ellin345]|uniref:phosphoglycolate phosphatase n=1 Tax=Koribacter versatilis (strain Ellin345) TaxID=204669 RepID=Q1INM8_KORVE|nr:HAD family hydrolase [Candidatus Koribacter versatilis]ABF41522.1 HAD-superfamily hydrolase, subfamily IA, variant 1 [Candidatus Koribacter versatilis Ellin345]